MLATNIVRNLLLSATLAFTSVVAVAQTTAEVSPDTVKVLSKADVDAVLASPDQVLIIDVRRPDELTSIGGFPAYLSIQSNALGSSLAWIPSDRAIVTVSNHAGRAKRAAALLTSKGFDVLGAVGVQDFEAAGGVLTRIAPPNNEQ